MRMAKQKQKKVNKKGYSHVEDPSVSNNNSPKRNSPRRRRRNINALSADDYKLRQAIEGDGSLTIIDIEADGNCLFRSISDQLYYDYGANHFDIRQEICDYIEGHKDDFSFFLVLDDKDAAENDEDASDFDAYVANMRQDGDWGGHLELVAASRMYRRNITVYSARLDKFTIEHESSKQSSGPDLLLSYHDNDHYNSIRMSKASKPPPPIKTYAPLNRVSPMEENTDDEGAANELEGSDMALEEMTTAVHSPEAIPERHEPGPEPSTPISEVEMNEVTLSVQPLKTLEEAATAVHSPEAIPELHAQGPEPTIPISEVEMDEVVSSVQPLKMESSSSIGEQITSGNQVDVQILHASDSVKESALVPCDHDKQSLEETPLEALPQQANELTPSVVSEEPTVDGNFKVLQI